MKDVTYYGRSKDDKLIVVTHSHVPSKGGISWWGVLSYLIALSSLAIVVGIGWALYKTFGGK